MSLWLEPTDSPPPAELHTYIGGHPLIAKVLAQRGITSPTEAGSFLDPRLYRPAPASDLPNLSLAADRITLATRNNEAICVWGDFDVDGQTSTTLLVSTLRGLGANVRYHIPVRGRESHGMKVEVVKEVIDAGVQIILTCDTGIAENEAIAYAQSRGVEVIVTDHHTLPEILPTALTLVNPQMLDPDHPLRNLPGVGVAYKLAEELYRRAGRAGEAEDLLDLVAMGIVADVAVQRADTRYLLQKGLERLRNTERLGLQMMFELAELKQGQVSEAHIGFALGPRLNALGRLGDANPIVEFLMTKDLAVARVVAQQLESLNAERKLLTSQIYQGALAQIEQDPSLLDFAALVVHHPTWEAGVIGIVAGRLAERFHRPAVVLTGEGIARGSARSVEGVNITEAIAAQKGMLFTFGGHPMAAGVSLEADRIPAFRRALSTGVELLRGGAVREPLRIDAFLPLADLSLGLVEEIGRLAPFGAGNPALTLATRNLKVKSSTIMGRTKEHMQVFVEDEAGEVQKVFWWNGADNPLPEGRFDLAYTVRASDYRGERQLQIEWVEARAGEREMLEVPAPRVSQVERVDCRNEVNPLGVLQALQARGVQVWAEGEARAEVQGVDRWGLVPAEELAVWTNPPGPREWEAVFSRVAPEKVYVFARGAEVDRAEEFLRRLAGLLKFAVRTQEGQVELARLAAATGQREETVQKGVEWLIEKELFVRNEEKKLEAGGGLGAVSAGTEAALRRLLEETQAYRRFWENAHISLGQKRST
ncbi:MAG: single-stranded-DNA-specific exonuclease RecJ [Anaerolineales bacterium]|nr:single-stranded-DNA-specific exonuclease RecJ [Anaerolineales bacterium]